MEQATRDRNVKLCVEVGGSQARLGKANDELLDEGKGTSL